MGLRCGDHEDETHAEVCCEDVTGLDGGDGHEAAGEEAVECVETLGGGEDVGCLDISGGTRGRG